MKKIVTSVVLGLVCGGFAACDTDYEPLNLQPAKQYSEKYYENLRNYKANLFERSICFVWFGDYNGDPSTPAYRFSALPDSVDICSLWGGYPDPVQNSLAYKEMWEMRNRRVRCSSLRRSSVSWRMRTTPTSASPTRIWVNQTTTDDPTGTYPDWCVRYGNYLLQQMWDNGIDGLDLDYEPESSDEIATVSTATV